MSKIELADLTSLTNQQSAVGTINSNMDRIKEAINKTVFRDGTVPNSMEADLDLNGNRILNLPEPVHQNEPVRKRDVSDATIAELTAIKEAAELAETNAETAESNAEAAQTAAELAQALSEAAQAASEAARDISLNVQEDRQVYLLEPAAANPTLDGNGDPVQEGAIYYNTAFNELRIYNGATWDNYTPQAGITDIVQDLTPQLGGTLDTNGNNIQFDDNTGLRDDSDNEQLVLQKTASAVNHIEITNAATGNPPKIAAEGDDTNIGLDISAKGTGVIRMLDQLELPAGTTASPPLKVTTGTNLTSPVSGAIEHDGKTFYATNDPAARQILAAQQVSIVVTDRTGANDNSVQALFDSATATVTLASDTTYQFEAHYWITRAAGSGSHTTATLFGGTATFTSLEYLAQVTNPTGTVLANVQQLVGTAATALVLTAASTSTTENVIIKLTGTFRVNAGGTLIPSFQYSAAPGGAPTIKAGTFFRIWPVGTGSVAAVGSWA